MRRNEVAVRTCEMPLNCLSGMSGGPTMSGQRVDGASPSTSVAGPSWPFNRVAPALMATSLRPRRVGVPKGFGDFEYGYKSEVGHASQARLEGQVNSDK